jgi:hypothetical protein
LPGHGWSYNRRDRGRSKPLGGALGRIELVEEVLGKHLDVGRALAQRRQLDREHVQPVVQVLAELAFRDRLARLLVGGGDDAHVGGNRLRRSDPHEGAGFQDAQQLDLQRQRHLGDLVEQDGAAVGALEEALVLPVGAGEAALFVAEQLAFDQLRRDGTAVDREERCALALGQVVDRARRELLAGAALADQQHRGRCRRDPRDLVVQ